MTNQDKTSKANQSNPSNQGGQAANQGKQGDPSDWNTQKTGDQKGMNKDGGSQMGGKSPPTGGPDQYKPTQPMEGDKTAGKDPVKGNIGKTGEGGAQGGSKDPYPPTNPDRPVMAGGQGDQSKQGGSFRGDDSSGFGAQGKGGAGLEESNVGSKGIGEEE